MQQAEISRIGRRPAVPGAPGPESARKRPDRVPPIANSASRGQLRLGPC